MRTIGGK
jgi:hypothetical protein